MLSKSVYYKLISGLKCSNCLSDFDEKSVKIMNSDNGLLVLKVACSKCSKSFGLAFLGLGEDEIEKTVSSGENALPITFDDVLDAHYYIQNLDENWKKFIQNIKQDK